MYRQKNIQSEHIIQNFIFLTLLHIATLCMLTSLLLLLLIFLPPPNVLWPKAYCFCPVRLCMRVASVCVSVHSCVHAKTLLTRYLAVYLTHFHQTYINDALWDNDKHVKIWGQRSRSRLCPVRISSLSYSGLRRVLQRKIFRN